MGAIELRRHVPWTSAEGRSAAVVAARKQRYQRFLNLIAEELRGLDPRDWPDLLPDGTDANDREKVLQMAMKALAGSPRDFDAARDAFIRDIRNDADALWALFAPQRREAIAAILAEASRRLRETKPVLAKAGGQAHGPGTAILAKVAMASLLETFRINGKPLGDVTVKRARVWSRRRAQDARFVEMLTANLPEEDLIRKWRTADDARRIFEEAGNA